MQMWLGKPRTRPKNSPIDGHLPDSPQFSLYFGGGPTYTNRILVVCIYMCVCACMDVCLSVCPSVCLSVCMHACMHVCISVCVSMWDKWVYIYIMCVWLDAIDVRFAYTSPKFIAWWATHLGHVKRFWVLRKPALLIICTSCSWARNWMVSA